MRASELCKTFLRGRGNSTFFFEAYPMYRFGSRLKASNMSMFNIQVCCKSSFTILCFLTSTGSRGFPILKILSHCLLSRSRNKACIPLCWSTCEQWCFQIAEHLDCPNRRSFQNRADMKMEIMSDYPQSGSIPLILIVEVSYRDSWISVLCSLSRGTSESSCRNMYLDRLWFC